MRNHYLFFRFHVIFIGCCFLLFGSLVNGQISWKPIENQKVSQYPVPLVKERYYELIPSKNQIKASKSNFNMINQTNKSIFSNLEKSITTFINSNSWSDKSFLNHEKE